MVSEIVMRSLNEALGEAANRRNAAQSEVNDRSLALTDAQANAQRAATQEANAAARNDLKVRELRELTEYYNGLLDKTGLEAIRDKIERLSQEQFTANQDVSGARQITVQRNAMVEEAKTRLAVTRTAFEEAQKKWQRMSEECQRASNER